MKYVKSKVKKTKKTEEPQEEKKEQEPRKMTMHNISKIWEGLGVVLLLSLGATIIISYLGFLFTL